MDLTETEPGRFRNSSEHDDDCLWMQAEFGTDVDSRLDDPDLLDAVTAHVEEQPGLALLEIDEAASKADIAKLGKQCAKRLWLLLDKDEWQTRKTLTQLLRRLREQGQSAWTDYNQFLDSLTAQGKTSGDKLSVAHVKTIRAWVTQSNPDAERAIDKVIARDKSLGERFGHFRLSVRGNDKIVSFERDSDLGDTERVPLNTRDNPRQDILDYFAHSGEADHPFRDEADH